MVDYLIGKGAPVDGTHDVIGASALWIAVHDGNGPVVQLLLDKGADPEIASMDGVTPLMLALSRADLREEVLPVFAKRRRFMPQLILLGQHKVLALPCQGSRFR